MLLPLQVCDPVLCNAWPGVHVCRSFGSDAVFNTSPLIKWMSREDVRKRDENNERARLVVALARCYLHAAQVQCLLSELGFVHSLVSFSVLLQCR